MPRVASVNQPRPPMLYCPQPPTPDERHSMLPLDGIRVIDLSQGVPGPFCARLMADQGADVIRVESPSTGDPARRLAPFPGLVPQSEASGTYQYVNLGKRGISLNLNSESGRRILKKLVSGAHVMVEGFEPGVMDTLGLGFADLSEINPGLVMTSVTNFGQSGPYKHYKSDELTQYGMGGPMAVTGTPDHPPLNLADGIVFLQAGTAAALAAMIAFFEAEVSGVGEHVDISIMEIQAGNIDRRALSLLAYQYTGERGTRIDAGGSAVSGILPTSNGYIAFDAATPAALQNLPTLLEAPELAQDPRFTDPNARNEPENSEMLASRILEWALGHDNQVAWRKAQAHRSMAAPINNASDLLADPHYSYRGFWNRIESPVGLVPYLGSPLTMNGSRVSVRRPAPKLGQHNGEVLGGELGFSREELSTLKQAGVI